MSARPEIDEMIRLLGVRYQYLDRKQARRVLGNGRESVRSEMRRLLGYGILLQGLASGAGLPKLPPHVPTTGLERRAWQLVRDIQRERRPSS